MFSGKNTYLIDGESLYVGHCSDFDEYNLMNPITGEFLLSSHIPMSYMSKMM